MNVALKRYQKGVRNLYYITHVDNVPSIMERGILSHERIEKEGISFTPVYDSGIVANRKQKVVDGMSLWRFANLYFQPRNPMLYRVVREKSSENIAVIAIRQSILDRDDIYITDGNAASGFTSIYPAPQGKIVLPAITKEITKMEWWNEVSSSKRKIMAECLVPNEIPPEFIESIYVNGHETVEKVESLLQTSRIPVIHEPHMFFAPENKIELTDNLSLVEGDLFFSGLQTLTVSVNTVGVMGKGLASRAKYQFPDVYVHYQDLCKARKLRMGVPAIYQRESSYDLELADDPSTMTQTNGETGFLLFPTKRHWRERADIKGIEKGLRWVIDNYKVYGIKSLAVPALGCGQGKLSWRDVGPLMCKYLSRIDIPVWIYLPAEMKLSKDLLTKEFLLPDAAPVLTKDKGRSITDF